MNLRALSADERPELTTAQFAVRVQVPAGTLRMWEARYGFPSPSRLPSGHRRYTGRDVDQLNEVLRLRDSGISLPAAIQATRARTVSGPASIFAQVRENCPELRTMVVNEPALLALTRALEDEHLAHGGRGVLIGSFEREERFRAAEARWRRLADVSDRTIALADFAALRHSPTGTWEVPIGGAHALGREWALLLYSPAVCGAIAGWEVPGARADRRFEVLCCAEPAVVHVAMAGAAGLLRDLAPELASGVLEQLGPAPAASTREMRSATSLSFRAFGHLLAAAG